MTSRPITRPMARIRSLARAVLPALLLVSSPAVATDLPIVDAHLHYSHDSVEMTPPARVIELMRKAGLRRALVSSSDDNGTQLLSALAPDLIIPGLRPYRQRGETGSWQRDPEALAYVESLLAKNRYASIGEFHLFGEDADLPIPRRIVELAVEHNLVLHAHSDAEAVRRLFKQNPDIRVIWAHAGFDNPDEIGAMLSAYPNLWADLAFRSDMATNSKVDDRFKALFEKFPTRLMLGTDTFTPERMYYVPEHAEASRQWLKSLPDELANNIAWRNAESLLMPIWKKNRQQEKKPKSSETSETSSLCTPGAGSVVSSENQSQQWALNGDQTAGFLSAPSIRVSEPFSADLVVCHQGVDLVQLDAVMPKHGHGMNYRSALTSVSSDPQSSVFRAEGLLLHMPGQWQWRVKVRVAGQTETLKADFSIQ